MTDDNFWDKYSCCITIQNCWNMTGFKYIITFLIFMTNFIAAAMNITDFSNANGFTLSNSTSIPAILNITNSKFNNLYSLGIILHCSSLLATIILTSYTGRYLSINPERRHISDTNYIILGYGLAASYIFFILILMFLTFDDYSADYGNKIVDAYSQGLIIYSLSFFLLCYKLLVFKPLIPNCCYTLNYNSRMYRVAPDIDRINRLYTYGTVISFLTKYGFYEDTEDIQKYRIWSSISLLIMFIFSICLMNASFAIYYNDIVYRIVLMSTSVAMSFFILVLQTTIFIANNRITNLLQDRNTGNNHNISRLLVFYSWIVVMTVWFICSTILFLLYFPYNNWAIDIKYPQGTQIRNYFYMIQGGIGMLGLVMEIIIGFIVLIISCCRNYYRRRYPRSITRSITRSTNRETYDPNAI